MADAEVGRRILKPYHLSPRYPSPQIVLYGSVSRDDNPEDHVGFAAVGINFPVESEILSYSIDDIPLWKTFVPVTLPTINNPTMRFQLPKPVFENKILNSSYFNRKDIDILEIVEAPIYFAEQREDGIYTKETNVLHQVIDSYSRLHRKSMKALGRMEHRQAKQTLIDLIHKFGELRDQVSPEAIELERKINTLYVSLTMDILTELN